ncbi:Bacteriocin biosynthesis cyclodehydratase domain-containing protein [Plantibacter sp. RU18]
MTTRIDPRRPLLWRTPHSLQMGVDDPVVLEHVQTGAEQLIAALQAGFPGHVEDRLADAFSIGHAEFERVMSTLAPVIERGDDGLRSGATAPARVAIDGSGPVAEPLRRLLGDQCAVELVEAIDSSTSHRSVDLAVLCGDYVIAPSRYARWLRDDVAHLPIVLGDSAVRIGPFVTPGDGPCLHCVELHRADGDPAWPAVASQLLGRRSPLDSLLLGSEIAARAARLVLRRIAADAPILAGTQLIIDASTGGIRRRVVREHSRCACRALPGTGTALDVHPVVGSRPRTGSGGVWRG